MGKHNLGYYEAINFSPIHTKNAYQSLVDYDEDFPEQVPYQNKTLADIMKNSPIPKSAKHYQQNQLSQRSSQNKQRHVLLTDEKKQKTFMPSKINQRMEIAKEKNENPLAGISIKIWENPTYIQSWKAEDPEAFDSLLKYMTKQQKKQANTQNGPMKRNQPRDSNNHTQNKIFKTNNRETILYNEFEIENTDAQLDANNWAKQFDMETE